MEAAARATAPGDPGGTPRQPVAAAVIAAGFYFEKSPIIETRATRSGVRHGRHGCADHGSVRSINRWKDGKETGDGKITVTMTLTDPAEGRAWAVWLLDHEPGLNPRRPAISYARARARPRWGSIWEPCGPDRGEGGKYLIVPPGYDGPLPEGGFAVARSRTNYVMWFARSFLANHNDPKPVADTIRKFTKIYPYEAGGLGTPIAEFLAGKAPFGRISPPTPAVFHEGSGKVMNTIPPNDFSFFEMLNEIVQQEPATSLDPELMGPIAAIGIVKGKPFAPDARMKKILTEAVASANATSRSLFMNPRDPSWFYYPGSAWFNPLFVSGYEFETPIPMITKEGAKPFPPTGYRQLDARRWYFYGVTGITPAMAMRVTGIGSQYLFATLDADKNYFDGAKTYKVTLPKGIPEANFWSLTLYDNQTRSMLDTPQRYPRAGSQSYPSPAAEPNADGSTTVYLGPTQPAGVKRGNWIQTMPEQGLVRDPAPLQPAGTVLRQGMAPERDRAGEVTSRFCPPTTTALESTS